MLCCLPVLTYTNENERKKKVCKEREKSFQRWWTTKFIFMDVLSLYIHRRRYLNFSFCFFFNTSLLPFLFLLLLLLRRAKIWGKIITDKSALILSHTEWMREKRKRNFGGCWQNFRLMTSCSDGTLVVVHVHLFGLFSAPTKLCCSLACV